MQQRRKVVRIKKVDEWSDDNDDEAYDYNDVCPKHVTCDKIGQITLPAKSL